MNEENQKINWNLSPEVTKHYSYRSLMLEITRECNLKCEHCMRGDAQNVTMSKEMIEKILSQVGLVERLSFTGGEPFLKPDLIEYVVDYIIQNNLNIMSLGAVTNGAVPEENMLRCIQAFNRFSEWAYKKYHGSGCAIAFSNDIYHGTNAEELVEKYKPYGNEYMNIDCQSKEDHILAYMGKSQNLNIKCKCTCHECIHSLEMDENGMILCLIQISAKGALLVGGNISYDLEDMESVGNVMTDNLDNMIQKYQEKYSLISCRMSNALDRFIGIMVNETDIYKDLSQRERFDKISSLLNDGFNSIVDHVKKKVPYFSLEDKRRAIKLLMSRETHGEYGAILMSMGEPEIPDDVQKELDTLDRKYTLKKVIDSFIIIGKALSQKKD